MPETIKNQEFGKSSESFGSRVQSRFGDVAHNVRDRFSTMRGSIPQRFQENRVLMYAGVGLLLVGAGFGIWSLVNSLREREFDEQSMTLGSDNFTRRTY